jgi:AhpD family alkylhydroperoxidase
MQNPAMLVPGARQAIEALMTAVRQGALPEKTGHLVNIRASQINGCSACLDGGTKTAAQAGESTERLSTVAAWREAPYFSDAERAALALTEAVTRLSDRSDPVADEVWAEATKHYSEDEVAGLVLWIAVANLFNRLNAPTKQVAGAWG